MTRSFTRAFAPLIVAFACASASAEYIAQEQAAEANEITVFFTDSKEGTVVAKECIACPLTLDMNAETRFFHNSKEIRRSRVESLSGTPGTVIYSKDGKQALRILW